MKLRFLPFLAAVLAVFLVSGQALAEKRVALVVGNGNYPQAGVLANPPNDARLMADTLRRIGFDVVERIDADQRAMKKAIKIFGDKLAEAGRDAVGLFFYAGHGVQVGGVNYLIPINVSIDDESDVDIEAVSAYAVQGKMAYAGNRLNIIVMDACRNNPFKRGFRSASRGLARMDASKGTLIAYATAPGDVAADGTGGNSPYTEALSRAMLKPGLTVERMFKQVRNDVVAATNSKQVPWESSSLTGGDFYFRGGPASPAAAQAQPLPAPAPSVDREAMFWDTIKNSGDAADFEAYLSQFPRGLFSPLARNRLTKLNKPQAALSVPPVAKPRSGAEPDISKLLVIVEDAARLARQAAAAARANPGGSGYMTWSSDKGDRYEGEARDGNFNGYGVYTVNKNGNRYEGEFRNDKFNGRGVYIFKSGRYQGEFVDDKYNGMGLQTFTSGSRYVGQFRDDKRNGRGVYTYKDGANYVGEFKDGDFHGQGVYNFASGNRYEGAFENDKFNGHGVKIYTDGSREEGTWKDDAFVSK